MVAQHLQLRTPILTLTAILCCVKVTEADTRAVNPEKDNSLQDSCVCLMSCQRRAGPHDGKRSSALAEIQSLVLMHYNSVSLKDPRHANCIMKVLGSELRDLPSVPCPAEGHTWWDTASSSYRSKLKTLGGVEWVQLVLALSPCRKNKQI